MTNNHQKNPVLIIVNNPNIKQIIKSIEASSDKYNFFWLKAYDQITQKIKMLNYKQNHCSQKSVITVIVDKVDDDFIQLSLKLNITKTTIVIDSIKDNDNHHHKNLQSNLSWKNSLCNCFYHFVLVEGFNQRSIAKHISFIIDQINRITIPTKKPDTHKINNYLNYLDPSSHSFDHSIYQFHVSSSKTKSDVSKYLSNCAKKIGLRYQLCSSVFSICEELITNGIYDGAKTLNSQYYSLIHKKHDLFLIPEHWVLVKFASSENYLIISVTDYFGGLNAQCFIQHLKKTIHQHNISDYIDNKNQGGAGLGLFKVLLSTDGLMVFSKKNLSTEVVAIINLSKKTKLNYRAPRSYNFFEL